jgi:peptidoglycan hydrolase CwlO-like protein
MLLNEFLKEHKKVETQQASIAQLKFTVARQEATISEQQNDFRSAIAQQEKRMTALTAQLKEQAAQIQKISAQIQISRPAPKTVLNNQ